MMEKVPFHDGPWEEGVLVDLNGKVCADLWCVCHLGELHQCLVPTNPCCILNSVVNRSTLLLCCNDSHPRSETILEMQPGVLS